MRDTYGKYLLIIRTPEGVVSAHPEPLSRRLYAARTAGLWLYRSGVERQQPVTSHFANRLNDQPLGTIWGHSSGCDFRILIADFTADEEPITPHLRVQTTDLDWVTIEPTQFMNEDPLKPGGQFFEGWYAVIREGESRPSGPPFNGERLSTRGLPTRNQTVRES